MSELTPQPDVLAEAAELIDALLDSRLSAADARRLEQLVCARDDVASMYLHYVHQECITAAHVTAQPGDLLSDEFDSSTSQSTLFSGESMVLPALRLHDTTGDLDAPIAAGPDAPAPRRWSPGSRNRLGVAAAVLLCAAGLWVLLSGGPAETNHSARGPTSPEPDTTVIRPPVTVAPPATVAGGFEPFWEGTGVSATPGSPVPAAAEVRLRSGLVELAFAGGARVTIEGPARFTADDAGHLSLAAGRLAAVVPPQATGFTVRMPSATVVDLGTEFGVAVNADGTAEVAVFQGQVRALSSGGTGTTALAERTLTQGQAANVSPAGIALDPTGAQPQRFVRRLVGHAKLLDVVDLLCGGDGTTARRGNGIDVTSGRAGPLDQVALVPGDGRYYRVPALPVVDGCFVPDGARGPVQVDSAGRAFAFPPTMGVTFGLLWAGGPIPTPSVPPYDRPLFTTIGDVDYAAAGRGVLWMHPNKGLTLDLAAIRRLHPGRTLSNFRGTFGNSYTPAAGPLGAELKANLYVLVDGQARFERAGITRSDAAFLVDVPLRPEDRFLTVATTDGGDQVGADWLILGDPRFDLASK